MFLRSTDHLFEEHRLILRGVYVLQAMGQRAGQRELPNPADVNKLLHFFRRFADDHHQGKEESILFPALRNTPLGKAKGPLSRLMFEHEQERSLVGGLEEALHTKNHRDFAYFAGRMGFMLSDHIYREDNLLFDFVEKAIGKEVDAQLVDEMIAYDLRLPAGLLDSFAETIEDLEQRYLVKVA